MRKIPSTLVWLMLGSIPDMHISNEKRPKRKRAVRLTKVVMEANRGQSRAEAADGQAEAGTEAPRQSRGRGQGSSTERAERERLP